MKWMYAAYFVGQTFQCPSKQYFTLSWVAHMCNEEWVIGAPAFGFPAGFPLIRRWFRGWNLLCLRLFHRTISATPSGSRRSYRRKRILAACLFSCTISRALVKAASQLLFFLRKEVRRSHRCFFSASLRLFISARMVHSRYNSRQGGKCECCPLQNCCFSTIFC